MKITIVKTLSNTILVQDFATKFVYKELQEVASLVLSEVEDRGEVETGGIFIVDEFSETYNLRRAEVVNTQVLPAVPVNFAGSTKDLYQLLETDFFYNLLNPPTAGGVNIYNTDGTLTEDRELTGDNFSLSFIELNKLLLNYDIKEEVIANQAVITIAAEVTLSGISPITVITIPLAVDFDTVEVFGRVIYRRFNRSGSGREDFFSSCTRNIGGVLELDDNNVQGFRRDSILGAGAAVEHSTSGTDYLIQIDPNSLLDTKFFLWVEIHKANIIV